ncbi:hypothetical protein C1H46_003292 [Malus baccata]|uniref:Receptor-like serine/threonine-protein kinase n=1 Tax=Malus baccata TaxID=106549 RepID=A0A540NJ12_MALBA|nr:hypothetical protein C1H46_003292 [Malus baccata]
MSLLIAGLLKLIVLSLMPLPFSFCTASKHNNFLVPGRSISAKQTLISSSGNFALGFFRPAKSTKYFLGIWYNAMPNPPIVWVANREAPLNSPGVLMLRSDGNLVVLENEAIIWSSNASVPASAMSSTIGLLMDSGNFVLQLGEELDKNPLWQSFDHPSDTLLPGMKISLNKRTGQQRRLTAWSAVDDPKPGNFSAGIYPKVPAQIAVRKENIGDHPYWRTAVYDMNGHKSKSIVIRNLSASFLFLSHNFDLHDHHDNDNDEIYFTYSFPDISSAKLRFVLDQNGLLALLLWQDESQKWSELWRKPVDKCDFYALCGPYAACTRNESVSPCKCLTGFVPKFEQQWDMGDWTGGCVREKALKCDRNREGFSKLEKLKLPDHAVLVGDKKSRTECEAECLKNCSCTAYVYPSVAQEISTMRCITWHGDLVDLVKNHTLGQDIYSRVHKNDSNDCDGCKGHVEIPLKQRSVVIAITIVSATAGILVTIFGYLLWKKTVRNEGRAGGGKNDTDQLPLFSLQSIVAATNNFSDTNKVGEGGFGPVYKGTLPENQEVAIKRLSKKSGQGHQEFINELKVIAKLQHTNLVRLLDPSEKTKLDWGKRFQIIEGIAQGVLYIHKYSRLKIIHRDLKASNILLDEAMNPKISDFGMAKIFEMNQIEANTNRIAGTQGYMSPEYQNFGQLSEKLDVYSFGVLLLEIVSGQRNSSFYRFDTSLTLWAWELWNQDRGMEVIDESVRETCRSDEALRCLHVGFLCVQDAPNDRPTMSSVINMLTNEATSPPLSKEPAFITHRNSIAAGSYPRASPGFSNNAITISSIVGR